MSTPLKKPQTPAARRVAAYRKRMREKGLVQKTIWTLDTRSPEFVAEAERQSLALAANDPGGDEWMAFLEAGGLDWPERT